MTSATMLRRRYQAALSAYLPESMVSVRGDSFRIVVYRPYQQAETRLLRDLRSHRLGQRMDPSSRFDRLVQCQRRANCLTTGIRTFSWDAA